MGKHGCGHCGKKFEEYSELSDHVSECDGVGCLVCSERFDRPKEKWEHDCPEKSDEPFVDPEAQFREQRRKDKRRREFERKMRKRREHF